MNPLIDGLISEKYTLSKQVISPRPAPDPSLTAEQVKQFNALVDYVMELEPLREQHLKLIYLMIELIAALQSFQLLHVKAKLTDKKLAKETEQMFYQCKKELKEQYGLFELNNFRLKGRDLPLVSSFKL